MQEQKAPEPPQAPPLNFKDAANFSRLFFESWALTTTVFVRRGFGSQFLGRRVVLALAITIVYPALWPNHDPGPMFAFLGLFIAMLISVELGVLRRKWRREPVHSRYNGEPLLMRAFPRLSEEAIKRWVEPLVVVLCGFALLPFTPPLAVFLILAGMCMRTAMKHLVMYDRAKAQDAFDAMVDARQHAERAREMLGNRY